MNRNFFVGAVGAAMAFGSVSASAAELIRSRSDFLSNGGTYTNRDFNDVASRVSFNGTTARYQDLTLSTSQPGLVENDGNTINGTSPFSGSYTINGTPFAQFDVTKGGTATITLDNASSAVGFNIRGLANARTTTLSFVDANGSAIFAESFFSPTFDGDGFTGFFGIRSETAIKTIQFFYDDRYVNEYFGVDDIVSAESAVPEPGSWALMLVGFGGIGFAMRRRKRATTVAYA